MVSKYWKQLDLSLKLSFIYPLSLSENLEFLVVYKYFDIRFLSEHLQCIGLFLPLQEMNLKKSTPAGNQHKNHFAFFCP